MPPKPTGWTRILLVTGGALCVGLAGCSTAAPAATSRLSTPAASGSAASSPSAEVTASAAASAAPRADARATAGGTGAELTPVDGGADYYAKFSPSFPVTPGFFPIGVWLAAVNQPSDISSDQAAGLNTYVQLTDNSDFGLVANSHMYFISNQTVTPSANTVGWFVNDEADMWGGPGSAAWTGKYPGGGTTCRPASAACGYTIQAKLASQLPADRRLRYANYGKGVTFWESDTQAARFVNSYQNVVSADNYWFTDENICGADEGGQLSDTASLADDGLQPSLCHLAVNYGKTVKRVRSLANYAKPVWGFVELGHPATENNWPTISPQQVVAAVWQSLIAGARGIIYFNHSFGGSCITDNVLRDPCYGKIRATIIELDSQIKALAPVLNAPFANGVVKAGDGAVISTKWYDGHFYLLAGASKPGLHTVTFSMPCVGTAIATVLHENRTITATNGIFTDRFADGNAVHIYRIDGGSSCGAY
jgi:hypothetical protein